MEQQLPACAVRELQRMLRTLAMTDWTLPCPAPDGVFGETTLEAVMTFQREHGLPVTGMVDSETWSALLQAERVEPGQSTPMLLPIQAMFCALSRFLTGIRDESPCGELDGATEENIRWLQARCGLTVTGCLDQATCDSLSRVYETFVARSPRCVISGK